MNTLEIITKKFSGRFDLFHALGNIIAKMQEKQIKDFSELELERVFGETVSPIICKRGVQMLIDNGLTIEELYGK
jgi:hypothetical protein